MAKCAIYEKTAHFRNNMNHSHRRNNRIWRANVESVKVKTEGSVRKMYICTSCLHLNFVEGT